MKQFWRNKVSSSSRTYWLLLKYDEFELQASVTNQTSLFCLKNTKLNVTLSWPVHCSTRPLNGIAHYYYQKASPRMSHIWYAGLGWSSFTPSGKKNWNKHKSEQKLNSQTVQQHQISTRSIKHVWNSNTRTRSPQMTFFYLLGITPLHCPVVLKLLKWGGARLK
jgi:hypothetical protein